MRKPGDKEIRRQGGRGEIEDDTTTPASCLLKPGACDLIGW
jgi:hypothetical protein